MERPTNGRLPKRPWLISTSMTTAKFSSKSSRKDWTSSDASSRTMRSGRCSTSTRAMAQELCNTKSFQRASWTSISAVWPQSPIYSPKPWAKTISPSVNDRCLL